MKFSMQQSGGNLNPIFGGSGCTDCAVHADSNSVYSQANALRECQSYCAPPAEMLRGCPGRPYVLNALDVLNVPALAAGPRVHPQPMWTPACGWRSSCSGNPQEEHESFPQMQRPRDTYPAASHTQAAGACQVSSRLWKHRPECPRGPWRNCTLCRVSLVLKSFLPPKVRKVCVVAEEDHSIPSPLQTAAFNYPNNCIRM